MDRVFARLHGRLKRKHPKSIEDLPDGAMIEFDGFAWAVHGKSLLRRTPADYREPRRRPGGIEVSVLTPPSICCGPCRRLSSPMASQRCR